jgi:hypothetical protein
MVSITKSLGLKGDVVSSMSLGETAAAGVVGGVLAGMETAFIPANIPTPIVAIGNVAAGLALKSAIGGSIGGIVGNGLTMTGAVTLGQWGAAFIMSLINGGSSAPAEDGEASAALF